MVYVIFVNCVKLRLSRLCGFFFLYFYFFYTPLHPLKLQLFTLSLTDVHSSSSSSSLSFTHSNSSSSSPLFFTHQNSYHLLFLFFLTVRSNYRQVVFSITLNFLLVFTQDGLPELGSKQGLKAKKIWLLGQALLLIMFTKDGKVRLDDVVKEMVENTLAVNIDCNCLNAEDLAQILITLCSIQLSIYLSSRSLHNNVL